MDLDFTYMGFMAETEQRAYIDFCEKLSRAIVDDTIFRYKDHPAWAYLTKSQQLKIMDRIQYIADREDEDWTYQDVYDIFVHIKKEWLF